MGKARLPAGLNAVAHIVTAAVFVLAAIAHIYFVARRCQALMMGPNGGTVNRQEIEREWILKAGWIGDKGRTDEFGYPGWAINFDMFSHNGIQAKLCGLVSFFALIVLAVVEILGGFPLVKPLKNTVRGFNWVLLQVVFGICTLGCAADLGVAAGFMLLAAALFWCCVAFWKICS